MQVFLKLVELLVLVPHTTSVKDVLILHAINLSKFCSITTPERGITLLAILKVVGVTAELR